MSESKMVNEQSICSNRENFHSFDERINPINETSDRANSVIQGLWCRQGNSWSKRQIFSSQSQSRIFVNVSGKTFILSHLLLVVVILHIHVFLAIVVAIRYSKTLEKIGIVSFLQGKEISCGIKMIQLLNHEDNLNFFHTASHADHHLLLIPATRDHVQLEGSGRDAKACKSCK